MGNARVVVHMFTKWIAINIFLLLISPQGVFAHALLERADPAPGSQLLSSPSGITLTFNERLERELFSIKVFDSRGKAVTQDATEMSQDQKELHLYLPSLQDGIYTVTYRVMSADGHPIRGSYVISVGEVQLPDQTDRFDQVNLEHEETIHIGIFGIRIFYFLSLLLIVGWVAWGIMLEFRSQEHDQSYQVWTNFFLQAHLAALLSMGFIHAGNMFRDGGWEEVTGLYFNTYSGLSLVLSLFLLILGFFVLRKKKWADVLWVILVLAAKSMSGHAMAFDSPVRTLLFDFIHVLAASMWAGGLVYLLLFWKSHREQVTRFLPLFSKAALTSILVLTITGTFLTLIFLPKASDVLETAWGFLLLAKVALAGMVVIVGAILGRAIKQNRRNQMIRWLIVDVSLMIGIICIVGVFTYLSPLQSKQPLYWEERDASVQMTLHITPNVPGTNQFRIDVSSAKKGVKIKQVAFFLTYRDDPEIAPIKVPLAKATTGDTYAADGPYLPFAGNWIAEVRVMDSEDNETVHAKEFTLYE